MTSSPKTTHTASPALPFHQDHQQSTRSPATRRSARGGAFRTACFGKMWTHKNVQKNSVLLGVVEAFFVGEMLFCFFWVLFFLLRGFGVKRVSVLFYRVFFSVEGRKPKNVCFKKDLHLDATFVFFRALNKEQATTESHAWDVEMLCWGGNFETVECSRVKGEDLSTVFGKGIRNGFCQLDEDSQIIFPWKEMMEITLSIHLHP